MESPQPPHLLDKVHQGLRLKRNSIKTEKSYVHCTRDFILFHNKRHPKKMSANEIRAYLSHLVVNQNLAASTQNVALSTLLFLYRYVLELELPYLGGIEWAKIVERVPIVFTRSKAPTLFKTSHPSGKNFG